jgi:hypothetical protein
MHRTPCRWLLPAAVALAVSAAQAQTPPRPAALPDPLDAAATVPAFRYQSTLSNYQRLDEVKPLPWRAANENVGRIGGWRAYAREASDAAAEERATPASGGSAMPAMPAAHGAHGAPAAPALAPAMAPMPAGKAGHHQH